MSHFLTDYLELIEDINSLKKIDPVVINDIVTIATELFKSLNQEELEKLMLIREENKNFIKDNFTSIYNIISKN